MLWWLIQNLIVAATLAGVVYAACRFCRIGPAGRHILWTIVMVKLVTPPLIFWPWAAPQWAVAGRADVNRETTRRVAATSPSPPADLGTTKPEANTQPDSAVVHSETFVAIRETTPQQQTSEPPEADEVPAVSPAAAPTEPVESSLLPWWSRLPWVMLTAAAWIGGSLLVLLRNLLRIARMNRLARFSEVADGALQQQVTGWAARLGIHPPDVRVSDRIASPLIWAAGRPLLLWPARFAADVESNTWQCVLVHELAHLKRRDHWVGRLELLAACIWWWNPLFWYVRAQVRENSELACDAWVVGTIPEGRRAYAEALLLVCESMSQPSVPIPVLGVGSGSRRHLERRLTMILKEKVPFRASWSVVLAVVVLAFVTLPAWTQSKNTPPAGDGDRLLPPPTNSSQPQRDRKKSTGDRSRKSVPELDPSKHAGQPPLLDEGKPQPARFNRVGKTSTKKRGTSTKKDTLLSQPKTTNRDHAVPPQRSPSNTELQQQIAALKQELKAVQSLNRALENKATATRMEYLDLAKSLSRQKPSLRRPARTGETSPFQPSPAGEAAKKDSERIVATHTITLQRTTYRLPANRAQALKTFLQEHLKAEVLNIELGRIPVRVARTVRKSGTPSSNRTVYQTSYQPVIKITTTPDIQKVIGQLIAAMRKDAPEPGTAEDADAATESAAENDAYQPPTPRKTRAPNSTKSNRKPPVRYVGPDSGEQPKSNRAAEPDAFRPQN